MGLSLTTDHIWLAVGFIGQALFASRFFVQLFKSEMEGRSVIPIAFWYFSLGGGTITLIYAYHLGQVGLPFLLAQGGGLVVYARNLYLIYREKNRQAQAN
ncbi:MAG: lipid-A-disaccharide synthase N-terminal domain-containing protein [Alphaproteobacteria bacterium]|nr:lipid-A-disaccharide synthase N-terminal domain-containing protein [Alphaproteobacteria bacterium]